MTILVTGATGNVGRHVVAGLLRAGERVRAVSRRPERAALPAGVEVVRGDLGDPKSFVDAFDGVRAMFVFPLVYLAPVLRGMADVAARLLLVFNSTSSLLSTLASVLDADFFSSCRAPIWRAAFSMRLVSTWSSCV